MRSAPSGGTKGGKSGVQSTEERIKLKRTDKHLTVIDEPLVTDALGLDGVGEELPEMRLAGLPSHQRALLCAQHVALLGVATLSKLRFPGNACGEPGGCMATQRCQTC